MAKTIWIMNHYASHMLFNKGGRHYYFAKYLNQEGYAPIIFCANIKNSNTQQRYFETEDLWIEKKAEEINTPFVYIKTRIYKGNGKQRVLNMFDFYKNVKKAALEYSKKNGKPDVILASSVHPLTLIAGIQLAKKYKVKCVCEVRDLWPESFVAFNILKKKSVAMWLLYKFEKNIYKKADKIIFTMEGGKDYIIDKGWDIQNEGPIDLEKIYYINNGVDLELFNSNKKKFQIKDEDLENSKNFNVVYTGTIRKANNVDALIDIAKKITNPEIKILIWGSGDEVTSLKNRIENEGISNVKYKGYVEKKYIPYIVSKADLNIIQGGNEQISKYGTSKNKMFDYFAACKPILRDSHANHNPIIKFHAGKEAENNKPETIAKEIERFYLLPQNEYEEYCNNAKKAAEAYDFKNLTVQLINIIDN